jgi:hypothetical protein
MAKVKLSKLLPSLESEEGAAETVDAKEVSAELGKDAVQQVADDGSGKGEVAEAAFEVDVDGKDFTAIDEASKRQGEAIHQKMERLDEACASTEAYLNILRKSTRFGLESASASVIAHDLKSMYPKFFAKLNASLEAIDDENEPARIGHTKEAEKEAGGKLDKLKGAVVEGWKKFMAWLKERWAKLKGMYEKIFGRTKKVKEANAKLLSSPTPETAAEVSKNLGAAAAAAETPESTKEEPAPQKPEPVAAKKERVTVANIGVLSGKDPLDMKKINLKVLTDLHNNWMKPTAASIKEVLRLMLGDESKSAQMIDAQKIAQEIIKVDFVPEQGLLPSNYQLEGTDNKWGFKMVQHDQPEQITDHEVLGPDAVKRLLSTNDETLDIALEMGEIWVGVQADIAKITEETKYMMDIGTAADFKKWVTEYLTTLSNSDVVPLTKLIIQATTARLLLLSEMTMAK